MIVIYRSSCLSCHHKEEWNLVKMFTNEIGSGFSDKAAHYSQDIQEEASIVSQHDLPFILNESNGKSIPFYGVTKEKLAELI